MRITVGIMLLIWAAAWFVHLVGLLGCECANVMALDFVGVVGPIIGGIVLMLPDRRE